MLPKLRVTPLGDVHGTFDWHERFVMPFGEKIGTDRVQQAEGSYGENLEELPIKPEVELDPDFADAWADQMGASFQDTRVFIEALENLGRERRTALLSLGSQDLTKFQVEQNIVEGKPAESLVARLLLPERAGWRTVPEGYEPKDAFPWRFKRRILANTKTTDTAARRRSVLVAPGCSGRCSCLCSVTTSKEIFRGTN